MSSQKTSYILSHERHSCIIYEAEFCDQQCQKLPEGQNTTSWLSMCEYGL